MSRVYFTQLMLGILLVYADCAYNQQLYYIKPSQVDSCPNSPCRTLLEFATDYNNNSSIIGFESTVSLFFLPGNHSLDRELSLSQINNFSMVKDTQDNDAVTIECSTESGRFSVNDTTFTLIKGLQFVGCDGNTVARVEQLVIEDCTFKGVEGKSTSMSLLEVTSASVVQSSFSSNVHSRKPNQPNDYDYSSSQDILNYVCLELDRNASLAAGGALYIAFSNVSIIGSTFTQNLAETGGVLIAHNSSLHIAESTYSHNVARFGGVMVTCESTIIIDNSTFTENSAEAIGGVMVTHKGLISVSHTTASSNNASNAGFIAAYDCSLNISDSSFRDNAAKEDCGVICITNSTIIVGSANFTNNGAAVGGIMQASGKVLFEITNSTFTNNKADEVGGVLQTVDECSFIITGSTFRSNSASRGGVIVISEKSSFSITNSTFTNNRAYLFGGVIDTLSRNVNITSSTFAGNRAVEGGIFNIPSGASLNIASSTFNENHASALGGVFWCKGGSFNVDNSTFTFNAAENLGGIMYTIECNVVFINSVFDHNLGSLYAFNSNLSFGGYTVLQNCAEPSNNTSSETSVISQEGGAITSLQSIVTFVGETNLFSNQARRGGAILATESTVTIYGQTTIAYNMATTGGGVALQQSDFVIKGNCTISQNFAVRGGGIHGTSSLVAVHQPSFLQLLNNSAENGSGIYLEVNPKLYVLKSMRSPNDEENLLIFRGNRANYGGAIYVADFSNSIGCFPDIECFIQTLPLHQFHSEIFTRNIRFSGNIATKQGSNIFGGLLDRCIPSPFAEVYRRQQTQYNGFTYLTNISNIASLDSIASLPVRVCFCTIKGEPDCRYQPPLVRVKKGETLTVSLVAVDQVNHAIDAAIISSPSSPDAGLGEGQQLQKVGRNCTNLTFNVFSPLDSEMINLYSDGPCDDATLSTSHLTIQFLNCTCPIGFEPRFRSQPATRCKCDCASELSPHITNCNSKTNSLLRINTNSWITYVNSTIPPGYVIHPNCPFDYCHSARVNVTIDLNLPHGADAQCNFNRVGVLCGACYQNLSLSLGTSRCFPCHSYWPAVFVAIIVAAIIAGILLVTALLVLNMTVAVGLINGFIFYGNIVAAGSTVFFTSSEPSFPTVFVAWLNLDIGIDVCFIDGLDAYSKTWIQLAFPVYIISLVIVIIVTSQYSTRFAALIGKRDPIATLATLVLLSYAKLLSVTISALSPAILLYPDGTRDVIWLPDGNIKYFQGKHVPLVLVALLIIIIGLPYTFLLFFWQWIIRAPRWKILNWTRSTKLNAFISSYHVPHNSKHRYWTGLLLLVRVFLYLTASVTVSHDPQTLLLTTIILVGGLFLLSKGIGSRVYKKSLVDIVDSVLYFNLLILAAVSLYDFGSVNVTKQTALAYTSTIVTLILLIGVIIYHLALVIKKDEPTHDPEPTDYHLAPVQPNEATTHSFLDLLDERLSMETVSDDFTQEH